MGQEEEEKKGRGGGKWRGETGRFRKPSSPCRNDQSHEFANRESLADQQRQRQIMREIRWWWRRWWRRRWGRRDTKEVMLRCIEGKMDKKKQRKIE